VLLVSLVTGFQTTITMDKVENTDTNNTAPSQKHLQVNYFSVLKSNKQMSDSQFHFWTCKINIIHSCGNKETFTEHIWIL
jgi:hypothetical protein